MSIRINIPSYLQTFTNNMAVVEVGGSTVGECLNHLVKRFPDLQKTLFDKNGKLYGDISIYVNREDAYPEELAKPVEDGDELHLPYIIVGG